MNDPVKMVILVNSDLKMGKGKIASQCAHAAIFAYDSAKPEDVKKWSQNGFAKIVLSCTGTEMQGAYKLALKDDLVSYIVEDAGKTQVEPGSSTVCAIGPASSSRIDTITSGFKLL